jgi:DNA-binding transcriptional LysR family regulator
MADLNSLVVFAKVVEASSFSEAARRLKMPVSTVSRRIAELEDELGVRLLERSTRSLRLTELGAEVLEHAARSAELSEAFESIVSNRLSDVGGSCGFLLLQASPTRCSRRSLPRSKLPTPMCGFRSSSRTAPWITSLKGLTLRLGWVP